MKKNNEILNKYVITIVENDKNLNNLIIRLLNEEGFKTKSFLTGNDAFSYIKQQNNLILILDYRLPDINAHELVRKIKKEKKDLNFIIITGVGDEKIAADSIKLGAKDYLVKDLDFLKILPNRIKRLLQEVENKKKLNAAENLIRENEIKYRLIFEQAANLIITINKNMKILDCNMKIKEILRFTKKNIINTSFLELVHPDYKNETKKNIVNIFKNKKTLKQECLLLKKNSNSINAIINWSLISSNSADSSHAIGIISDISQIKKIEKKLEQQYLYYKLRSEIWKLATNKSLNENELIQNILNKTGQLLNISRTSFMVYNPKNDNFTVHLQWCNDKNFSTLGEKMPGSILMLYKNKKIGEFPNDLIPELKPIVSKIIKKYKIKSYLLIKYGNKFPVKGIFMFEECKNEKNWSSYDKTILMEAVNIISIRSKQIEAEKNLINSENRYKELFSNMSSGVVVYKPTNNGKKFIIQDINKAGEKIINDKKKNIINKDVTNIFPGVKELGLFDILKKVNKTGKPEYYPINEYKDDRISFWAENYVYKLPSGFIIAVFDDVSEKKNAEILLKESEERFRMIFKYAPDAYYITDISGNIIDGNKVAEDLLGYKKEELISKNIFKLNLLNGNNLTKAFNILSRNIKGESTGPDEFTLIKKDKSQVIVEIRTYVLNYNNKKIILGIARDITKRKKAELEIQKLNISLEEKVVNRTKELREIIEELESFTYSISHDLRTPLRHINGFTQILYGELYKILNNNHKKYLQNIISSTSNMSNLIDDLLDFSKMGRKKLNSYVIDLNELINESLILLNELLKDKEIVWKISKIPKVKGDPALLKQVFINLISNAVKYSKTRKKIIIEIGFQETSDEFIIIFIKDNGIGFKKEFQEKIFGVFQRLHDDSTYEGTGIGLAIVKKIILKHGGEIWAKGKINKGSVFYFTLKRNKINKK